MKGINKLVLFFLITCISISSCYAEGFYDQRYRGWLWFEDKTLKSLNHSTTLYNEEKITPNEAKAEIDKLAKDLEERKFMMLARPTVENVKLYREKEKEMWDKAMKLSDSWEMANLIHPEQLDLINNPINVHAVKLKREQDQKDNELKIKAFAKGFDLILFFKSNCQYCEAFGTVLHNFGQKYGFNIEALSMDGSKSEFFKTTINSDLVKKLGIEAAPTVIAVSHDSKVAFELIRGYVSMSELEEHTILAFRYLKEKAKK